MNRKKPVVEAENLGFPQAGETEGRGRERLPPETELWCEVEAEKTGSADNGEDADGGYLGESVAATAEGNDSVAPAPRRQRASPSRRSASPSVQAVERSASVRRRMQRRKSARWIGDPRLLNEEGVSVRIGAWGIQGTGCRGCRLPGTTRRGYPESLANRQAVSAPWHGPCRTTLRKRGYSPRDPAEGRVPYSLSPPCPPPT